MLVRRTERLARENLAAEPDEADFLTLDPRRPEDFEELVREALDDLPDLLRKALDHVAVVISDKGRRHRAYGLYQGDTVARDNYPDRIIIFRDTLLRDFGHDADELRAQVTRTVRHELAHHLGADELGSAGAGPVMIVMTPHATDGRGRGGARAAGDDGPARARHAGRADDRDRRHRRPRGGARGGLRGHGGRRPRRPDLAPLQARLVRALPRGPERVRHRRPHGRRQQDVLPDRRPVHGGDARADDDRRAHGQGGGRVDAARRRLQAAHVAVRVQGPRAGRPRDPRRGEGGDRAAGRHRAARQQPRRGHPRARRRRPDRRAQHAELRAARGRGQARAAGAAQARALAHRWTSC